MAEELIADAPVIGETSLQGGDTKAEDTEAETRDWPWWDTLPKTIRELVEAAPLLPHEFQDLFFELFESFLDYAEPETIIEYNLVYTATVSNWESQRYREMAAAVTTNQHQAGLASLFEQADETGFGRIGKILAGTEARKKAIKCSTNEAYREQTYSDFARRGYIPEGQAFLLSLPALSTIERLLTGSEKRYNAAMKEIEKRMAIREAKLQAKATPDLKAKTTEG